MVMKDMKRDDMILNGGGNGKYKIEKVEQIEYLGVTLTNRGDEEKELNK